MHVISQRPLRAFWHKHPPAETPLRSWYKAAEAAKWKKSEDVKSVYRDADRAGKFTIFDLGVNKWRLIVDLHHNTGTIYVRHVFTHAEYDEWNKAFRKAKKK